MRVAVATVYDQHGTGHVIANFLFRAVGGLGEIKSFQPFAVFSRSPGVRGVASGLLSPEPMVG